MLSPSYIGDGVYAQVDKEDPTRIILTTGSHILADADAIIYLEVSPLVSLKSYINRFLENE